jgi:phosphomannomutase
MKATMRQRNAVLGGELSGHFYWRENFYADSGVITMINLLNILSRERRAMSELLKPLRRYSKIEETNFEVEDKTAKIAELAAAFKAGRQDTLDGLSVDYDDWWFNVRPSNTEPVLRLNLEAKTPALMEEKKGAIGKIIEG